MFDDIDIGEDDSAEVVEEKSQKKSLLQVKMERLKKRNADRQQELSAHT
jgi:hypothetical protein